MRVAGGKAPAAAFRVEWHMRGAFRTSIACIAALLWYCASAATPATAASKAFVIGNSKYVHANGLPNPANDAKDLATKLGALGYQVTLGLDVTRAQFLSSFQRFAQSLQSDDLAVLYYAGHGLQIGGENYLFPIDARVEKEDDARQNLVALNALLADLSRSTRNRIVILDACRNNPFADNIAKAQATRAAGTVRGLARVYAGVGSFIAYSTQPGNVALDGSGRNSPFTEALLRHMGAPGADVHAVMRRVRGDVQKATSEQQVPWENSSLVDEISFATGGGSVAASPPVPAPAAAPPSPARLPPAATASASYHFVSGLDPKGDNFLALRTGIGADVVRIATMGPDTLLKVVESRGEWRKVVLLDGTTGWAHGRWIACCRTFAAAAPAMPAPAVPPAEAPQSCEALWTARNAIWHRHGYCFTTARGQNAFGNAGCSRDERAARAAMSPADRDNVDALQARERAIGCR